ncbi:MAG: hypothetical protein QHJ82_00480 [Verrucomicrobiota bacterium]|nr:hypothetical protein [Verrucomicrobiota bacterium]
MNQMLGLAEAGTTLLDLMGGTGRLVQAGVEETKLAAASPLPGAFIVLHTLATPQIGPRVVSIPAWSMPPAMPQAIT